MIMAGKTVRNAEIVEKEQERRADLLDARRSNLGELSGARGDEAMLG